MSGRPFLYSILLVASFLTTTCICSGQTPVDVLYAQRNTSILTYTVDQATLQATQVGDPLILTGNPEYVRLIPSPSGHFVYVMSDTQDAQGYLSVYATDASGVPQTPAVQTLGPVSVSQFTIDPNGQFAYALEYTTNSQSVARFQLRLFTIDGATGKLTQSPQIQAKYPPSEYCGPGFAGFYPDSSQIEIVYGCNYPDSFSQTYYFQTVDPKTGELGPVVLIFGFNDNDGGTSADEVMLSSRTVNNFHVLDSQASLRIYPLAANAQIPIIDCTAAMLPACGEAGSFVQDVSGKYLALSIYPNFQIVRVDLVNKQIIDTGSSFSDLQQPYFSPDDRIMYGVSYQFNGTSTIHVYGFNQSTGALIPGSETTIPATLWNVFPATRN